MISWRENWVDPFESPWNIIEKFKYINQITNKDLKASNSLIFVDYIEKNIGSLLRSRKKLSIETLSYFGINNTYPLIYPKVKFCPLCIRDGYHSFLHQLSILHICPFHQTELYTQCPNCNSESNYTSLGFDRPYTCECKYEHINRAGLLSNLFFKENQLELPFYIKDWIHSPTRTNDSVEIIPIYGDIPINVFKLIEEKSIHSKDYIIKTYLFENKKQTDQENDFDKIYNDSKSIYSSTGRYIRKFLNIEEAIGIRRLTRISPEKQELSDEMASYLLWKMYVSMNNDVRDIDNGRVRYPIIWDQPKFAAKRYNEILNNLYNKFIFFNLSIKDIHKFLIIIFGQLLYFDFLRIQNSLKINAIGKEFDFNTGYWNLLDNNIFLGVLLNFESNQLFLISERQL